MVRRILVFFNDPITGGPYYFRGSSSVVLGTPGYYVTWDPRPLANRWVILLPSEPRCCPRVLGSCSVPSELPGRLGHNAPSSSSCVGPRVRQQERFGPCVSEDFLGPSSIYGSPTGLVIMVSSGLLYLGVRGVGFPRPLFWYCSFFERR